MKRSDAQRAASRLNGSKSKGPKSAAGKLRSVRNNLRHGTLSNTVVLNNEDPRAFSSLLTGFRRELNPTDTIEDAVIENLAVSRWCTQRLWSLETASIHDELTRQQELPTQTDSSTRVARAYRTLTGDSRSTEILHRYEARCDRQFNRSLSLLLKLRVQKAAAAGSENQILPFEPTSI